MDPGSNSTIAETVGALLSLASRIGVPWWLTLPLTLLAVVLFGFGVLGLRGRIRLGGPPPQAPDRPGDAPDFPMPYQQQGPPDEPPGP